MAIKQVIITDDMKPSEEQLKMLEEACQYPSVPDDDCPELTKEQLAEVASIARKKRALQKKPAVTMRISVDTLDKAKAVGKGYTGFLSRLLDLAINDPDMVKKCL